MFLSAYIKYFILVLMISLGTMVGCNEDEETCGCIFCDPDNPTSCAFPPLPFKECNADEYICAGECTTYEIDCCIDSFGDEVGSCPNNNPFCCEEYDL